jgi:hypothetical protein
VRGVIISGERTTSGKKIVVLLLCPPDWVPTRSIQKNNHTCQSTLENLHHVLKRSISCYYDLGCELNRSTVYDYEHKVFKYQHGL